MIKGTIKTFQVIDGFGSAISKPLTKSVATELAKQEQAKTGFKHFIRDISK